MTCKCPTKLRATNVTAIISMTGHLTNHGTPLPYEEIVFCQHPCCERVFRAVGKWARAA